MALMPPQHEFTSDEEDIQPEPIVQVKPVVQIKSPVVAKPESPQSNKNIVAKPAAVVRAKPVSIPKPQTPQTVSKTIIKKEFLEQFQVGMPIGTSSMFSMTADAQSLAGTNTNTKNIVKNYGKAMCSFAASDMSLSYLKPLAIKENIKADRFKEYFRCKKELVGSIESFRNLYIEDNTDNEEIKAFKRIFKEISIMFIKFFSVNWIFNGKLTQKQAHLKYRFKMLRRIKNPELFTYLKG